MAAANASSPNQAAKAAHVNMMTDTIIANLPPEGLRAVLRGLLGTDVNVTPNFHSLAAKYLKSTELKSTPALFVVEGSEIRPSSDFLPFQARYRCLMGCGSGFDVLKSLTEVLRQVDALPLLDVSNFSDEMSSVFAAIDGDIVQTVTAIQKELLAASGTRVMTSSEAAIVSEARKVLISCMQESQGGAETFAFARGLLRLERIEAKPRILATRNHESSLLRKSTHKISETVQLEDTEVPRMFMGLWQFSSPAWGTASQAKINAHFRKHLDAGFTAYDMADHYGDAEVTFGQFRNAQPDGAEMFCATKWCVFGSMDVTPESVAASISERLANIDYDKVELLQFHWQNYDDHQYVEAAKLIDTDTRVLNLGLCNFDTQRMNEILEAGVHVVSNQVQFSLIDLRPIFKMAESCKKHNVKLLTYGSLCGGFLADKWLGKPAPNLFEEGMTPSHRKYFEMIAVWGGWALFQDLLSILSAIGTKHNASISSVAIRWVLEHEYVGAVIIGARMGISEHVEDNLTVFDFRLDREDLDEIEGVLEKCKARDVFDAMGDCGAEYRG